MWSWWCGTECPCLWSWGSEEQTSCHELAESLKCCPCSYLKLKLMHHKSNSSSSIYLFHQYSTLTRSLTCTGGAVGVVAGVRGRSVAPQAGVALAVGSRRVACCAAELRGATAGADGTLAWNEPTSNCGGKTCTTESRMEAVRIKYIHVATSISLDAKMPSSTHVENIQTVDCPCYDRTLLYGHSCNQKDRIRCYMRAC